MVDILCNVSLFLQLGNGSLAQITGEPIRNIRRAETTQSGSRKRTLEQAGRSHDQGPSIKRQKVLPNQPVVTKVYGRSLSDVSLIRGSMFYGRPPRSGAKYLRLGFPHARTCCRC